MKRFAAILSILLLYGTAADAQHESGAFSNIAQQEKKSYEQRLDPPGNFTFASNNFSVSYARMHWNINPAVRYIAGTVTNYFTMIAPGNQLIYDLDNSLIADSVLFRNNTVSFLQNSNKTLTIDLAVTLDNNTRDSITIFYHGTPPNNGFGAFTQTTHNSTPVIWTLSEPYGARDWWPCRNGLDDKIDSIDIYIQHPSSYVASANGVLTNALVQGNDITTHYRHRYPIATYLVGIAVTNYSRFSQELPLQTGDLPVTTTVYPEDSAYFQDNIPALYTALQLYDAYFAPYPFMKERYGQTQFSWGGGMEHQTNSFVVNADEYLMAHELAHQWFGDKITCASWQDIWLNEGFATYLADMFYTEHVHPDRLQAIIAEDLSSILRQPHGSVQVDDATDINRIFSNDLTYKKGAFLLRMLRYTLGDLLFFKGLHLYQNDTTLQYGFAHTTDLQRNMEKASSKDLSYFFNQWFYGKGFPSIHITWSYSNGYANAMVNETTSDSAVRFFKMPVDLLFKNNSEQQTVRLELDRNNQRFTLPINFVPDTILIDPMQYLVTDTNSVTKVNSLPPPPQLTLLLYPNPVMHILHVRTNLDESTTLQAQIFNTAGINVIGRSVMPDENAEFTIPVTKLSAGVYYLSVRDKEGKIITQQFIKY